MNVACKVNLLLLFSVTSHVLLKILLKVKSIEYRAKYHAGYGLLDHHCDSFIHHDVHGE